MENQLINVEKHFDGAVFKDHSELSQGQHS